MGSFDFRGRRVYFVHPSTGEEIRTDEEYEADTAKQRRSFLKAAGRLGLPSTDEVLEAVDQQIVTFDDIEGEE